MQFQVFRSGYSTFLAMRLLILLITVACLHVSATGFTQTVTLSLNNAPLEKAFIEIRKQTGYSFIYIRAQLKNALPINCQLINAELKEALMCCFHNQPLSFIIEDNYIIVQTKLTETQHSQTQGNRRNIKGRVINDKGEPVEGASIMIKGTQRGTTTNGYGYFELKGVDENDILIVTGISIEPKEVKIIGKLDLTINVKAKISEQQEVIINAGYYSTTDRLRTGNISRVDAATLDKQPVNNVLQALESRVPGLFISQNTGVPGGNFTVQIRGRNSILNGNDPLYIVDGVPFTSTSLNTNLSGSITGTGNPLNSINPADIESIEVLKDADATAIYGSRGANGVILITSKKGKPGQTDFNINVYSGIGKVSHFMRLLNTQQYMEMRHEAFNNDGTSPQSYDYDLTLWDTTRYTDWQKLLLGGSAHYTDMQSSISGGNQNTQFLLGGGYHKETTVFPGNFHYEKGAVHFSLNHSTNNKKLTVNFTADYIIDNNNLYSYSLAGDLSYLSPIAPSVYDSAGHLNWENGTFSNPLAELQKKYISKTRNLISNALIEYHPLHGLTLKTSIGYTRMQVEEIQSNPLSSLNPFSGYTADNVYTDFANNSIETWIIEPQAEYRISIGHGEFNALIGTTFQNDISQGETIEGTGFSNDNLIEDIASASSIRVTNSNYSQYRYNAWFGRLNYNWRNKYIVNLTGRRDGSSRFGPDKQFANFGAAGGAWIFSSEKFIKNNLSFLSFGKIRASYGTTGNDQIVPYQYLSSWSPTTYTYQGNSGLQPVRLANPDYSWEVNKKLEVALELGLLRDRVHIISSYFRNRSSNQLIGRSLPASTGFGSIQYNLPALVENTGFEFELNSIILKNKKFTWNSFFNFTIPHNKLIDFPNIEGSGYSYYFEIGQPLTVVKAFHFTGVNPQTGVYQFQDIDKDGSSVPTFPSDLAAKKKVAQDFYGGFSNNLQYKGWQIDVFFQFVKQTGYNYLKSFGIPGTPFNQPTVVLNRWQKPGDKNSIQKFTQDYGSEAATAYFNNSFTGDGTIGDASFIRLKTISISYQLNANYWKKKTGLNSIRLYLEGQNLFTITNYLGLDPETQQLMLPPLRVIVAGIQIKI
jgi:TonB-dependent starch-binding outer membrane protein SusC